MIGLTAYNSVIIAEILRAGVTSLPRGQREAGLAIGLSAGQAMRSVLLPQAFRIMLPALISQLVVVLKDTSLVAVLGGYIELLRRGNLIAQQPRQPDPGAVRGRPDLHPDQLRAVPARDLPRTATEPGAGS